MKNIFYYQTAIGRIGIAEDGRGITNIFINAVQSKVSFTEKGTELIKEAARQINEFIAGKRKSFDLPLSVNGSEFQMTVWNALKTIPYGQTCTYKDIAAAIGNPKACRAVGMANNKNPIPLIVPCHRVIGANGSLIGYAGGLDMKRKLLEIEKMGSQAVI